MKALILAGGFGTRLRPLSCTRPKTLFPIVNKPLLQWILEWLKRNGVNRVIIGVAYKKEKVIDYFGDGAAFNLRIRYSQHTVEGGTSEGFKLATERHVDDQTFLAMNGDELVDINLSDLALHHHSNGGIATIAVGPLRSPYGVVEINGSDVIGFREKPILRSHLVSVGVYVFSKEILGYLAERGNIEQTAFPTLASMRKLKAYVHNGFWATINTIRDLEDVEKELGRR
jgi:mannose-1-phosphate guanylyltransferase